jgi:carbon storage regulator
MLVLTRRCGERILIGENVWVTIVSVERGKVRLGIQAPPDVLVLRQELADARPTRSTLPVPTVVTSGQ